MTICIPLAMLFLLGCAPIIHHEQPPSDWGRYVMAKQPCEVEYPPHSPLETGWKTYRTYEVYHLAMFREMCEAYYVFQQPKNHGIMLSRGASNF